MNLYRTKLSEKLKESLEAVVPIIAIVLILSFTIAPVPPGILMAFIIGAILLIVGMMFFTLGAEMSMTPMGERIGTRIAQSKRLPVIIGLCFVLGFIITISEPDLQVLAGQVPSVSNMTLILAVAVGVGIFLVAAVLRMLFSKPLSYMLLIFYPVVFILTFFVSKDFLAIAFDSGGVTTGPMTVPFIMALGIGFSAVRSDKYAETDSFGLVSLCSIGPVLAVLLPTSGSTGSAKWVRLSGRNLAANATSIAEMKSDAVVLNMARGGIVNEHDLYVALTTGQIRAAASDVFVHEPPACDDPLIHLDNFIATFHIGGSTYESLERVSNRAVDYVFQYTGVAER
mgnify:CR=1 FL=1